MPEVGPLSPSRALRKIGRPELEATFRENGIDTPRAAEVRGRSLSEEQLNDEESLQWV